jgi:outer membrane protein OmpA-like peptidoglycan-associated protein
MNYDGTRIVFIKETTDKSELVECIRNIDGSWAGPKKIDEVNNFDTVKFTIDAPSYNYNSSAIYFSVKYITKNANANIFVTNKVNGTWSKPERLPAPVNSPDDETDPFLSPDGNFLFFARKIQNPEIKKVDCYKLFVSEKKDGIWQKPLPLPEPVNAGCDRMPRLAPDGNTLYFSSIRGNNKENFKLQYAKKITKNAWTSPVALDSMLSLNSEIYPSVSADGKTLFYQSDQVIEGNKELNQIVYKAIDYQFQPEKSIRVSGIVSDLKTDFPLKCKINIIDPNTSMILFQTETDDQTGEYSVFIPFGRKYMIDVYKENYSHYFFSYDALKLTEYTDYRKNIKLYPEVSLIVNIFDSEVYEPLKSILTVIDSATNVTLDIPMKEIGTGRFSLVLPIGKKYIIEAQKNHYENNRFDLDLKGVVQFSEFERDLDLQVKKVDYVIQLQDAVTGEGVEAMVEIINLSTNEKIVKQEKTDNEGKLNIKLRDGTRYEINIIPQGYSFYNTTVDLMEETVYVKEVKLTPLKEETKIELNDINFETNSADLNKSSFEELDRVVKLLLTNPNMKIEISAHTDDVGTDAYNLKLSDKRAVSVKEYLFSQSIPDGRIVSKGYGESKPAYLPADTNENRAKNRRVELKVLQI